VQYIIHLREAKTKQYSEKSYRFDCEFFLHGLQSVTTIMKSLVVVLLCVCTFSFARRLEQRQWAEPASDYEQPENGDVPTEYEPDILYDIPASSEVDDFQPQRPNMAREYDNYDENVDDVDPQWGKPAEENVDDVDPQFSNPNVPDVDPQFSNPNVPDVDQKFSNPIAENFDNVDPQFSNPNVPDVDEQWSKKSDWVKEIPQPVSDWQEQEQPASDWQDGDSWNTEIDLTVQNPDEYEVDDMPEVVERKPWFDDQVEIPHDNDSIEDETEENFEREESLEADDFDGEVDIIDYEDSQEDEEAYEEAMDEELQQTSEETSEETDGNLSSSEEETSAEDPIGAEDEQISQWPDSSSSEESSDEWESNQDSRITSTTESYMEIEGNLVGNDEPRNKRGPFTPWHYTIFAIAGAVFLLGIVVIMSVIVRICRYRSPTYKRLQDRREPERV